MKKNIQPDSTTEITKATLNGVTHLLIAENKEGVITYKYQTYNQNNKFKPFTVSLDLYNNLLDSLTASVELYNNLLELYTINPFKLFKVENYLIVNGVKWENIENINISTVGETMCVVDDALSHGFSFLVHNHKLYYKEEEK